MSTILRTQIEIVERARKVQKQFPFGGMTYGDLVSYLSFEHAKEFLVDGATQKDWDDLAYTTDAVLEEMRDYVEFTCGKIQGDRGLSIGRAMQHYENWLFLLGNDDRVGIVQTKSEGEYASNVIDIICEVFEFKQPDWWK